MQLQENNTGAGVHTNRSLYIRITKSCGSFLQKFIALIKYILSHFDHLYPQNAYHYMNLNNYDLKRFLKTYMQLLILMSFSSTECNNLPPRIPIVIFRLFVLTWPTCMK